MQTSQQRTFESMQQRTFESIQTSQERMLQQAINAVSAREQIPMRPAPQPRLQPQPQLQPQPHPQSQPHPQPQSQPRSQHAGGNVIYNIQRGSNVVFGRNSRAGAVADTPGPDSPRPTSVSEWARDVHPDAQSETTRDTRPLIDRMTFPLESRMTYDTQSDAGSSSKWPRGQNPTSYKRERSPSAYQGSTTSGRNGKRRFRGRHRSRSKMSHAPTTHEAQRLEGLGDINAGFNSSAQQQHDAQHLGDLRDADAEFDDPGASYHR